MYTPELRPRELGLGHGGGQRAATLEATKRPSLLWPLPHKEIILERGFQRPHSLSAVKMPWANVCGSGVSTEDLEQRGAHAARTHSVTEARKWLQQRRTDGRHPLPCIYSQLPGRTESSTHPLALQRLQPGPRGREWGKLDTQMELSTQVTLNGPRALKVDPQSRDPVRLHSQGFGEQKSVSRLGTKHLTVSFGKMERQKQR